MSFSTSKEHHNASGGRSSWGFWALFLVLAGLAVLARGYSVGTFPAILHNDEASCVLHGALYFVLPTDRWALWGSAFGGHPNFSFWLSSLVAQVTADPSLSAYRMASAISGTLSLVVFALFLARSYGSKIALFFLLFSAAYHFHVHFSRTGFIYIHSSLLFSVTSLCLALFLQKPKPTYALLLGASLGLSALAYPATHVLPFCVVAAIVLGVTPVTNQATGLFARARRGLILLSMGIVGLLLAMGPQIINAIVSGYSSRLSATFIFNEQNIRHLAPQTGVPNATALDVLWFNLIRTLKFFTSYDEGEQYRFVETPIDPLFGVVAVVGLLALMWRALKRDTISLYLLGVATSTVLASAMMVEGPFSPHLVLFGVITPLAIALGWDSLLRVLRVRHVALATIFSAAALAYWANWNWLFYQRVVTTERSRMADLENAISFLTVNKSKVTHLLNLTPKAAGFGETYYQVMYPQAVQTKLPPGDIAKLEDFLRDKKCPCVVAVEFESLDAARERMLATKRKVTAFPRPEKKLGFLYIEDATP